MTREIVYTTTQARALLHIGRTRFWRAVKDGEIETFRWLGKTYVRAEDLASARDAAFARRRGGGGVAVARRSSPAPPRSKPPMRP
jgi:hypothetical protein